MKNLGYVAGRLGHLYVLEHPMHPGLVKVGKAFDCRSRLSSYNAGDPDRRYSMPVVVSARNITAAERAVHKNLKDCHHSHEWFRCSVEKAEKAIVAAVAATKLISVGNLTEGEVMSELRKINVSGVEEWREYDFDGRVYRVDAPVSVEFRPDSTTHRVTDSDGVVHCLPAPGHFGCVLRWKGKVIA